MNSISKKELTIHIKYNNQDIWMPLDNPTHLTNKEITVPVKIDQVVYEDKNLEFDGYTIYMTKKCNFNCSYCFVNRENLDSIVAFTDIVQFIEKRGKKEIQIRFFGGEPLIKIDEVRKWVIGFEKMREKGYSFSYGIVTNGSLLSPEIIDFLYEFKFIVIISHELNDELQQKNRAASLELQLTILKNIQYLSKTKLANRTTVRCMLDPNSPSSLLKQYQYAVELGIRGVQFDIPHVKDDSDHIYSQDSINRLKKQIEELTIFYWEKIEERDYRYLGLFNLDNLLKIWILRKQYIDFDTCGFGINHFAIDVDGTIYPCQNFAGVNEFSIGNVMTGINEKQYATDIERHKECCSCELKELCTKRCYYSNYIGTGDIYKPNNMQCEMKKEFVMAAIYLLYKLKEHPDIFEDYTTMLKVKERFLR